MTDEVKVYVYGSCHFSERNDTDEAVGNGGYGVVINVNGQRQMKYREDFPTRQMHKWT